MLTPNELVLINLILSAMLTGLIWTIQMVHYPGFLVVGTENFLAYQQQHMRTVSYIVIPLMLSELAAAFFLLMRYPTPHSAEVYLATAMVVIIWLTTMLVSSPLHSKLAAQGYNAQLINWLIATNWLRTAAWSTRTGILVLLAWQLIKH